MRQNDLLFSGSPFTTEPTPGFKLAEPEIGFREGHGFKVLDTHNPITLSIITPVFNQAAFTVSYLSSHWAYMSTHSHVEWIIIDNGSTDNTPQQLQNYQALFGDRLRVVKNATNQGFGPANNVGAWAARGKYLLFLNNDIQFTSDYSQTIIDALKNDPSGLYGPEHLLNRDTGWNRFRNSNNQDILIEYIAAWCLAVSKDVFFELGGFDDLYAPAYYEDLDLCHNAQKKGFPLYHLPVKVFHISGQTGMHLPKRNELTLRNKERFAKKWGYTYD